MGPRSACGRSGRTMRECWSRFTPGCRRRRSTAGTSARTPSSAERTRCASRTSTTATAWRSSRSSPSSSSGSRATTGSRREPAAEIAFVVADEVQHHGVATLLFESLAAYARTVGIARFVAEVLLDNADMLDVFGATGLGYDRVDEGGTVRVEIDLRPTPEYLARCDARESIAETASVAAFMRPRSIAVVGAGRTPGSVGHELVRSLLAGDFAGTVYPVNPHAQSICGVPAFSSLFSLPGAGRSRDRRDAPGSGPRHRRPGRDDRRAVDDHHHRRLRRDRRVRRGPRGRDAERRPSPRHANRRPELPRRGEHRSCGADGRDLRRARPPSREARSRLPVRGARRRARARGRITGDSVSRASPRSATSSTSARTTCSASSSTTNAPR